MKFQSNAIFNGTITANSVADAGTNTDKFLVLDSSGLVAYRTAAELYTDLEIGSMPAGYTSTVKHAVKAGVALTKGQAVYVTSADGTNMIVGKASNGAESTSSKTMGLIESTLSLNGIGNVITEGLLAGLDTTGANAAGDPVWLGTNGNLIYGLTNKPYAPAHLVFIGIVTRVNANNGEIFVKVQNGFEIDELHNVDLKTTTPINGNILGYDGTLWVNKTIAGWLGFTPADDSLVVHKAGAETITGSKTFDSQAKFNFGISLRSFSGYMQNFGALDSGYYFAIGGITNQLLFPNTVGYDYTFPATNGTIALVSNLSSYVPTSRTITINGTSYDLSDNRSWTINSMVYPGAGIAVSTGTAWGTSITDNSSNWNTSYGWGNHASAGYVPGARTITINGTTYDLSADRSWTISGASASTRNIQKFTATANQTTFTITGGYTAGLVDVFQNGVKLDNSTDFTASNGTTVVLTTGAALNDIIEVYVYTSAFIANNTLRQTTAFTATAGQQSFTVNYSVGFVDVFYNGSKLAAAEYTATTGTSISLATACLVGDIVEVVAYNYTVGAFTGIGGAGTTNYHAKFTASGTIGNSLIYDNGTNVGIGTTNLYTKLNVNGSAQFGSPTLQTSGTEYIILGQNSSTGPDDGNCLGLYVSHAAASAGSSVKFTYQFRQNGNSGANLYGEALKVTKNAGEDSTFTTFHTNSTIGSGTERLRITSTGLVGIGTSSPADKLNVVVGSNGNNSRFDGPTSGLIIQTNATTTDIISYGGTTPAYRNMNFSTSASTNMTITTTGVVQLGSGGYSPYLKFMTGGSTSYAGVINTDSKNDYIHINGGSSTGYGSGAYITLIGSDRYGTNTAGQLIIGAGNAVNNSSYGFIALETQNNERARLTNGGALVVGTTTPASNTPGIYVGGAGSSYFNIYQNYSGTSVGLEMTNSANTLKIQFFGSSGNYYFAGSNISDRRSKSNIQLINQGLSKISLLKPSTFTYDKNPDIVKGGFIAQEVLEVIPEFVTIPDDEKEMMGVDYFGILALAVKSIQELKAEIDELKSK